MAQKKSMNALVISTELFPFIPSFIAPTIPVPLAPNNVIKATKMFKNSSLVMSPRGFGKMDSIQFFAFVAMLFIFFSSDTN